MASATVDNNNEIIVSFCSEIIDVSPLSGLFNLSWVTPHTFGAGIAFFLALPLSELTILTPARFDSLTNLVNMLNLFFINILLAVLVFTFALQVRLSKSQ